MIGRLTGTLFEKNPPRIGLDVQGVGYEVEVSMSTLYDLPEIGSQVTLLTHLVVREDAHILYGFATAAEREAFRLLIKISGVGPRTALAILSGLGVDDLGQAVALQEPGRIVKVPGIGKKTAQRVILDLKDKIDKTEENTGISQPSHNTHKKEALSALETLGYSRKISEKVVTIIITDDPSASVEHIIKLALKKL